MYPNIPYNMANPYGLPPGVVPGLFTLLEILTSLQDRLQDTQHKCQCILILRNTTMALSQVTFEDRSI